VGEPKTQGATERTARGAGVLVVEDDAVNRQVLVTMLKRLGCRVDEAADGAQAVERALANAYDLVLMDWQLPGMDGLQATAAIRMGEGRRRRRVPIVAVTARLLEGDRERCLKAGLDDFLQKPFTFEDLKALVADWVR